MSLRRRRRRKERVQDNGGGHFRLREKKKERRNEVRWRIETMDGDHSRTEAELEFGWNYSWA